MHSPFQKVSVYHSQLVQQGQIVLDILSEPTPSKFPKGDSTHFISFQIGGSKHQLILENQHCNECLTGYKGQTVTLEASGSREDATITVLNAVPTRAGAPQAQPPRPAPARPAPQQARQHVAAAPSDYAAVKRVVAQHGVLMDLCLRRATLSLAGIPGCNADVIQRLATTLYIQLHGYAASMPTNHPLAQPQHPVQREPEPDDVPMDEPELAAEDINF